MKSEYIAGLDEILAPGFHQMTIATAPCYILLRVLLEEPTASRPGTTSLFVGSNTTNFHHNSFHLKTTLYSQSRQQHPTTLPLMLLHQEIIIKIPTILLIY